jgi:exodeoxyribonuclease VII small subunit
LVSSSGAGWTAQSRIGFRQNRKAKENAVSDQGNPEATIDVSRLSFDEALLELQRTVAELEQGGLPLERSIALYERGVALHERCAALLGQAELRVQKLLERSAGALEAAEVRASESSDQE